MANEKEATQVARLRLEASLPFIVLSELYYLIWTKRGRIEADLVYGTVKAWGLPILFPTERVIVSAGRLKAMYRLGIADSYIAAFAREESLALVTKDRDYEPLKGERIELHFL